MTTRILVNFETGLVDEAEGRTLTPSGGPSVTNLLSKFGSQSLAFNTGVNSVTISGALSFSADFTIETWFFVSSSSASARGLIGQAGSSADLLRLRADGRLESQFSGGFVNGQAQAAVGVWHHAALTRNGTRARIFLNGINSGGEVDTTFAPNSQISLSSGGFTGVSMAGVYLDGIRVILGRAIYTQNFAVPTSPPTIEYPLLSEYTTNVNTSSALRSPLTLATPLKQPGLRSPLYINRVLKEPTARFYYDPYTGTHRVTGTTKVFALGSNLPVSRRVQLIDDISGNVVRQAWSDPLTGVYSFDNILSSLKYSVVSYDHTGLYKAVIADNLTPTSMP